MRNKEAQRGLITDELGAAIVGANVSLTDAIGVEKKTTTNGEGVYTFSGLTPGEYGYTTDFYIDAANGRVMSLML